MGISAAQTSPGRAKMAMSFTSGLQSDADACGDGVVVSRNMQHVGRRAEVTGVLPIKPSAGCLSAPSAWLGLVVLYIGLERSVRGIDGFICQRKDLLWPFGEENWSPSSVSRGVGLMGE